MIESGIQIRFSDLLYTLWKRKLFILLITAAGLVFGLMFYLAGQVQESGSSSYTICTAINLVTVRTDDTFTNGDPVPGEADYDLSVDEAKAAALMLGYTGTANTVISNLQLLGIEPDDITDHLTIDLQEETPIITLSLVWSSEKEGKQIIRELVNVLNDLLQENFYVGTANYVDDINVRTAESWYGNFGFMICIITAALGFFIGAGAVILEIVLHPTFRNADDIEDSLDISVLGTVPAVRHPFRRNETILLEENVDSQIRKSYSIIAHVLQNLFRKSQTCKTLYVTAALSGEGCTSAAANLAAQLSYMEHKVLLIDLNFVKPELGSMFLKNVAYENTINAYYHGEATKDKIMMNLSGFLDLIPAALEMERISPDKILLNMINDFKKDYDYIIIDTADVHTSNDVLNLRQVADGVIFVIQYAGTSAGEIRDSLLALNKSGVRIIGSILNQTEEQNNSKKIWARKNGGRSYGGKLAKDEDDADSIFASMNGEWKDGKPGDSIMFMDDDDPDSAGYSDENMMQELLREEFSDQEDDGEI